MGQNRLKIGHSLEEAQRDLAGHSDGPMRFDAKTVAYWIRQIAEDQDDIHKWMFLESIAGALDEKTVDWQLVLKRAKPGKFETREQRAARLRLNGQIYRFVTTALEKGLHQKAAIADAQQAFGVGRAKVYAALKSERRIREFEAAAVDFAADTATKGNPQLDRAGLVENTLTYLRGLRSFDQ